jgi:hypothetical protein
VQLIALVYGGLAMLENLVFPYEVFGLYTASMRQDLRFVALVGAGVAVVLVATAFGAPVVVLVLLGEAAWFGLRLRERHAVIRSAAR